MRNSHEKSGEKVRKFLTENPDTRDYRMVAKKLGVGLATVYRVAKELRTSMKS